MALIEDRDPKKSSYTSLFGIEQLGMLITKIQSATISRGTDLEREIYTRAPLKIDRIDEFLENTAAYEKDGVWIAGKEQITQLNRLLKTHESASKPPEPDFLGFDALKKILYIFEVKAGHTFDTKKASGEHDALRAYRTLVSRVAPCFEVRIYISCFSCFDAETKEEAHAGLKKKFSLDEILTGREFCDLVGISYDDITRERARDQKKNLEYFVRTLLQIDAIKAMIVRHLKRSKQ